MNARSHGLDPSQLFAWRRQALASGLVAPVSGARVQAVKFARFDAVMGGSAGMIPAGVQVYVACTPVDFRKGATGLMALVRDGGADPFSGALYVFRKRCFQ